MVSRSLLVIAVGFPPMGGSGVQRTTKFVKYLPEFGWRAAVVTGDPERDNLNVLDASLSADISDDTAILRLPYWNPAEKLLRLLFSWYHGSHRKAKNTLATATETPPQDSVNVLHRKVRELRRIISAPVGGRYFYWARRARVPALKFALRNRVQAIYASASPYSSLLMGLWLKNKTGLPLIADFRDPWTLFHPQGPRGLHFRINRHSERRVLANADAIVTVNENIRADFGEIEPTCRDRVTVITNGFDPADFLATSPIGPKQELVHVGVAWEDSPQPVLRALADIKERGQWPAPFKVRFLGGLPPSSLRMIQELNLQDIVVVEPRVDHPTAVAAIRSAACLLLLPGAKSIAPAVPGKTFEYLASGRPILCVSPTSPARKLMQESGCGLGLHPDAHEEMVHTVRDLATDPTNWVERHYHPRPEIIEQYDRRKLTGKLASVLDQVVTKQPDSD